MRRNLNHWRKAHGLLSVGIILALTSGCQQKMALQPSYKPLDASSFFADGRSARPVVPGTVARGYLKTDNSLFTGRQSGKGTSFALSAATIGTALASPLTAAGTTRRYEEFVREFPFPITEEIVVHGRNRYMIFCVVCHDPLGTGKGKIVERGFTPPPSYHIDRLRKAPVGHLYAVITEGYGSMPSYAAQIPPRDRWAIVAYIRALQLSQHFPADRLSEDLRHEIESAGRRAP